MPTLLIANTFDPDSGFANEAVVSSFVIHTQSPITNTLLGQAFDAVSGFYASTPAGSTQPVGAFLASNLDRGVAGVSQKAYDITNHLSGTSYGSPIATDTASIPGAYATNNLPPQVASVLTLRARGSLTSSVEGPGNTRPRARKSGRLFIGSLNRGAADDPAGEVARPGAMFRTSVLGAAEAMQDALNANGMTWCVWSRTLGQVHAVTSVEMDDSFDVIRSRKQRPSVRTKRVFAPEPSLALGA